MGLRFHPNVSILYPDLTTREGVLRAAEAGFRSCEFWWPSGEDRDALVGAFDETGLEVELFNLDAGDLAAGDRGFLSDPRHTRRFREGLPPALQLADRIGARKLNALLGHRLPSVPLEEQIALARDNIRWAADRAGDIGASILIEAINTVENGPYLLPTTPDVANFIQDVGRPNVKIQYDVYHMQRMEGNLVPTLARHMSDIRHIQIADAPYRSQPGTGEISFPFVLGEIDRLGYGGSIGLEYRPRNATVEASMSWLPRHLRGETVSVQALRFEDPD